MKQIIQFYVENMSPERSSSPEEEQIITPKMSVPASPIAGTPAREADSPIALLLAVAQGQCNRPTDDDLTSLSWLHERDVLKGINLVNPSPSNSVHTTPVKAYNFNNNHLFSGQSPTSDFVDDSSISTIESTSSSLNSPTSNQHNQQQNGSQRNKHPHNVPYNPLVHLTSKPPYSFSCLIFMAIEDSEQKALPVKEIYAWILDHFPYFRNAPTGWKNSVRHNLSLNKCFQKVEKAPNLAKGSLWTVDPQFRPNLLQTLTRSPFHPCSTLDPTQYFSNKTTDKNSSSPHLANPEVFPYLSRTLASNEIKQEVSDDSLDAVDAAAVMLSLKNGPRYRHRKDKTSFQVITNSPSEDHTYSASENLTASNDEAFESDDEKYYKSPACRKIDFEDEEQRKIQEGAETLLNLAGISTRKRYNSQTLDYINKRKRANQFIVPTASYEKPTHFRPRLLRTKKKEKTTVNNNNHIHKNTIQVEDEWVKHRRELEEGQKR